jgi:bacteriorhodopsin
MKNKTQNQLINDLLQSSTVKYVLYGIGAIALIYVSGIVMKVEKQDLSSKNY